MKMICPKEKECKLSGKIACVARKPHEKNQICYCDVMIGPCPKCVPYKPKKPKSMFAGLRKGDRVEIAIFGGATMVYYVRVDKIKLWYKVVKGHERLLFIFKSNIKSIKKLTVKR